MKHFASFNGDRGLVLDVENITPEFARNLSAQPYLLELEIKELISSAGLPEELAISEARAVTPTLINFIRERFDITETVTPPAIYFDASNVIH